MAVIREELQLSDQFSQTFRMFDAAANSSINVAETFQKALNEFSQGFLDGLVESLEESRSELYGMADATEQATDAQRRLVNAASGTQHEINNASQAQDNYTNSVERSEKAAGNLMGTISKIAGAIGVVKLTESFIETSDEMSQITAKLNLINDGTRSTLDLQEAIYESAQRARGSYMDTANLVARLGMNAGEAFKSNSEMLQFAENLNKSFKIAGASAQEQASVILQMSQALAGGVLRGQEFNAVMSGAPNVMRNIADYMDVSVGKLRDMAAEGEITAETVKNALLAATDSINAQFDQIPITFGDVMTSAKNKLIDGMGEVFNEWAEKLGEADVQGAIDKVVDALLKLMQVGGEALVKIAELVGDIADNWEAIEPIVITAGIAILGYKATNIAAAAEVKAAWAEANAEISAANGLGSGFAGIYGTGALLQAYNNIKNAGETAVGAQEYMQQQLERKEAEAHADELKAQALRDLNESIRVAQMSDWYAETYGKTYPDLSEAFNRNVSFNQKAQWYVDYYTKEPEFKYAENRAAWENKANWYEEYYGGKDLIEEIDETLKSGVDTRVRNEVKLSDEDLKIFRDIAENRYIANVSLETLAPSVSVNVENNGQSMSEDDIATAVTKALETQISEHTAISHG